MTDKVKLQLGDIIQISAPNDSDINEHIYYIVYIDENNIRLEEADGREQILTLTDGNLDNESIESIRIKSRAEEIGYARQNNFMNGVWIDIYFNGDLPITLTGKITNLEEDRIEVTTFPDNDVIFIDFQYKGLPEDLHIDKIQIRKAPDVSMEQGQAEQGQAEQGQAEQAQEQEPIQDIEEPSSTEALEKRYNELQRQLLEIPSDELTNEDLEFEKQQKIKEQTNTYIFNADQIQFGEDLEVITQLVDVPEEEQRYDIDKQLDDLLDDMLSTVPTIKRTDVIKNDIHKMIQRFKQLRDNFSIFDEKGYVMKPKINGLNYKPLVGIMERLDTQLYWMLPVVKNIKKIYNESSADEAETVIEMGANDIELIDFDKDASAEKKIVETYEQNNEIEGNKYALLQKKLNPYLTPFLEPTDNADVLIQTPINSTISAVIDNLGNFDSSVKGSDTFTSPHSSRKDERKRKLYQKRFAMQPILSVPTVSKLQKYEVIILSLNAKN